MTLRRLTVRDFRNFEKLDVEVPEAGMVVIGENGHGKTNLLEAVSYLGLFRSMRGSRDVDAIRFGAPAFHLRAELRAHFATVKPVEGVSVGYERASKRKKAVIDGVEQTKLSNALGAVPSVCFSPSDVALIAGGPAERRHFLDVTLALTDAKYLQALQLYRSALKQRNAALRSAQRPGARRSEVEAATSVWEPSLAEYGALLAARRMLWCDNHASRFSALCAAIGERSSVTMKYDGVEFPKTSPESTDDASGLQRTIRDAYLAAFDKERDTELRRGITRVGPHRDDLRVLLGSRDLRTFGSAGQQRTAAIALRMLELETRRQALDAPPLLLLDDPFAELDARRSARILRLLEETGVGQVIMVVPRDEDVPTAFTRLERRAMVSGQLWSSAESANRARTSPGEAP
ncbi:MAG: DNA replication/repair protein RecF [Gemmatimonas sp.]